MPNALREFVLDVLAPDAGSPGDEISRIDDPRFSIVAGARPRSVRRTWLDTFDWRLFRAGLTLELVADRGAAELVLTGRDGGLVAIEHAGRGRRADASPPDATGPVKPIKWPCKADALPLGPLREHIAPVIGVRALLPVARAVSAVSQRRALNADDKTIAFVTIDEMTPAGPRPARTRPRIAVTPLRGYQAHASKLADLIAAAPGVAPSTTSAFETAVAATGRRPGDYTSKIDVQLAGTTPATLALATILSALFDTLEANVAGTVRDIDTEFLHDLRVAVRRTRSVLKIGRSVLPASLLARYRPEFKWLGDLTTPTRDLDVYLLGFDAMSRQLVSATTADLLPFHDHLCAQRDLAYRQLVKGLRSARFADLSRAWRRDLDGLAAAPRLRPAIDRFAARRIARAHQKVLACGAAIDAAAPPQALHELRKRCKELRYALEVFASMYPPAQHWRAVAELKVLQDCLGAFQDTEVQRGELRTFAAQMMAARTAPAETLLAMGEIAATLAGKQRASRGEFAARFAEFASPRGQARIDALTGAAQ